MDPKTKNKSKSQGSVGSPGIQESIAGGGQSIMSAASDRSGEERMEKRSLSAV